MTARQNRRFSSNNYHWNQLLSHNRGTLSYPHFSEVLAPSYESVIDIGLRRWTVAQSQTCLPRDLRRREDLTRNLIVTYFYVAVKLQQEVSQQGSPCYPFVLDRQNVTMQISVDVAEELKRGKGEKLYDERELKTQFPAPHWIQRLTHEASSDHVETALKKRKMHGKNI